jgi:hypothetical protein
VIVHVLPYSNDITVGEDDSGAGRCAGLAKVPLPQAAFAARRPTAATTTTSTAAWSGSSG